MTQRGVAEEVGRALHAVEGWLRAVADGTPAEPPREGSVRDLFATAGEQHTESACDICPLCRAINAARAVRPDIVEHLVDAAGSVLLALRTLAEPGAGGTTTREDGPTHMPSTAVQHIPVN
jgi:hypothetical protein